LSISDAPAQEISLSLRIVHVSLQVEEMLLDLNDHCPDRERIVAILNRPLNGA
jgi:hypothetical protein